MEMYIKICPDHVKTHKISKEAIEKNLEYVSDKKKTQKRCEGAVDRKPLALHYILEYFKTLAMCYKWVLTILAGRCSRPL